MLVSRLRRATDVRGLFEERPGQSTLTNDAAGRAAVELAMERNGKRNLAAPHYDVDCRVGARARSHVRLRNRTAPRPKRRAA